MEKLIKNITDIAYITQYSIKINPKISFGLGGAYFRVVTLDGIWQNLGQFSVIFICNILDFKVVFYDKIFYLETTLNFVESQKNSFTDVLGNRRAYKFHKFLRKTPVLEKTPTQVFSCEVRETFKNTLLTDHLWWLLLESSSGKLFSWKEEKFVEKLGN